MLSENFSVFLNLSMSTPSSPNPSRSWAYDLCNTQKKISGLFSSVLSITLSFIGIRNQHATEINSFVIAPK